MEVCRNVHIYRTYHYTWGHAMKNYPCMKGVESSGRYTYLMKQPNSKDKQLTVLVYIFPGVKMDHEL